MTLIEAIEAAKELEKEDIKIRIMDLFTMKPIDKEAIIKHAKDCGGKILTVEDHYPEGMLCLYFKPLSPKSYQHQISPCNIHAL